MSQQKLIDLHMHSTYSDGSGPPRYAYAVGRANGLHFLALTDHGYYLNDARWADTLAHAAAATVDGSFVALRGFEWTGREGGHIDVFGIAGYASRDDPAYDTLSEFYQWLAGQPTNDGYATRIAHRQVQQHALSGGPSRKSSHVLPDDGTSDDALVPASVECV